jgi:hypothetical protein
MNAAFSKFTNLRSTNALTKIAKGQCEIESTLLIN